jgi:hypothetical protein
MVKLEATEVYIALSQSGTLDRFPSVPQQLRLSRYAVYRQYGSHHVILANHAARTRRAWPDDNPGKTLRACRIPNASCVVVPGDVEVGSVFRGLPDSGGRSEKQEHMGVRSRAD